MKHRKWIIAILGAIVVVLLLQGFVGTSYTIPSKGMENTLYQGECILVNKWSYGLRTPFMGIAGYHRWQYTPMQSGDIAVFNNPASFTEPIIDKREVFIGRCIAVAGESIILDSLLTPVSSMQKVGPDRKLLYTYPAAFEKEVDSLLHALQIPHNDLIGGNEEYHLRSLSRYEIYLIEQSGAVIDWLKPTAQPTEGEVKEILIPRKGQKLHVNKDNAVLYANTLFLHEGVNAEARNDTLYIDNKAMDWVVFNKDYYWMASNSLMNLSDSRLFGFVPHDHLIGRATFILSSKTPNGSLFDGYRWNRFFRTIK